MKTGTTGWIAAAGLAAALAAGLGCSSSTAVGDGGTDEDATVDAACVVDCAPPPPGCRWEGPSTCDPPSCGTLVCDDGGAADAGGSDAGGDTDAGGTDGGGAADASIVCGAGGGGTFPDFDKSCETAGDCDYALHQTDCCGNTLALGFNAAEREAFEAAEDVCRDMYPACGCPSQPPLAEDGSRSRFGGEDIAVECTEDGCMTYVTTADGGV